MKEMVKVTNVVVKTTPNENNKGGGEMNDDAGKIYYMREFKTQLIRFLDELIEQFPLEGEFVLMRIFINDQIPITDVIGRFIRDALPMKSMIVERNEKFFLETYLFRLPQGFDNKVDYFRKIWTSDQLTDEDRAIMWKWADVFIHIGEMYFTKYGYVSGWEPVSETP